MIKCEVIENFTLENFNKLKNVKKVINRKENEFGAKDTFECTKDMADYLLGNNAFNKTVVKVIEIIKEESKEEMPNIENVDKKIEKIKESVKEEVKKNKKKKKEQE